MHKELIAIFQMIQNETPFRRINLCDRVVNDYENDSQSCESISCRTCLIYRTTVPSNFATQMKLTMEAVNHETRNPTPD